MNSSVITGARANSCPRPILSRTELARRMHDHAHITKMTHASLFKTGELDVVLLQEAGLSVSPEIASNPIVGVKALKMALNDQQGRIEPVFEVRDQQNATGGTYFASAFKSLTI